MVGGRPARLWRRLLPALALLLAGCAQPDPAVLRFALASAPLSLDPRYATDAAAERIDRLLYARLSDFDAASRPVPALARWQRLAPTRYRFFLRPDRAPFSDGSRLTARDVKATYDYVLDPAHASPLRSAIAQIAAIRVVDDDTFDILLRRPDPLLPAYLALGILPARLIAAGHDFNRDPVGSGPFTFVAREAGGGLRLRRRRDGMALEFVRVNDPTVRVMKLLHGEVDMLQNDLPPELVNYLRRRAGVRVETRPGSNFSYLGFNLEDPATGDPRVRRAVALAIDRAAVIRYLFGGGARPASALLPPDHWAGAPELPLLRRDLPEARQLLAAAGYGPGHPLRLTYKTSSDPLRLRLAAIFQRQLAEAGIEVTVRSYDWSTFYGDVKAGRFQLYSLAWVGIHTPDVFRYAFHSASLPPAGANRGRLRDPQVDRLIEEAEAAPTLQAQAALYRRLQARLQALLPYVPLWYEDQVAVLGPAVRDYHLAADGNYDGLEFVRKGDDGS